MPELNILSLTFLTASSNNYPIAILHLDHNQNLQLLTRDLLLSECELSPEPSLLLPQTLLSTSVIAPTDVMPCLALVPPLQSNAIELPAGVLVLGGRKIQFFELSSEGWQEKRREKQRKFEGRQKSADQPVSAKTKEKDHREIKKRRPKSDVEWPWFEVTA